MTEPIRNYETEFELEKAIERGDKVWVIGDVHGHSDALENLISEIDPNPGDRIVFLGDLIDRGPDSRMVIRIARKRADSFVLRGNHEQMTMAGFGERKNTSWAPPLDWLFNGGKQCLDSYRNADGELNTEDWIEDVLWMAQLPHLFVLEKWILVHAGLDPKFSLEEQKAHSCLWIRKEFHDSKKPIESEKTVVFGHSITHRELGQRPGELGLSEARLSDGRPLWVGIDTGACDPVSGWLTGLDLTSGDIIQANDQGDTRRQESLFKRN
ncbi:MAG: metallophosphoesterase family protein [Candidatus Thalassarchaeaceae archaeon]|jgi:serine/threonine protein phosphatase 1|nr:metallophosphoesterase family protein [Candidatus Thalassarchaeaceae archaeon]